ncbi:CCDC90 family protein [Mycoavidus sp. SF9855]|uniref:CCDC90 family protein n=1 Tax=Mycoavidus sp. SF9855 TaxID=2968475 RepID=UPI00211C2E62|nr:CCDC90 family protein [Mycoavidus sp. SF9855]UUM21037.1 CCDC90 family protein [Mycoavidus sp. SF9855]
MTTIPFDTLLFVETLTETGVDEKQAKAISTAVYDSYKMADFVTKTDHRLFESSIRSDLEKLSIELRHEVSDLRKDMNTRFAAVDAKLESLQLHLTLKISSIVGGILIAGLSALGLFMKALISASL